MTGRSLPTPHACAFALDRQSVQALGRIHGDVVGEHGSLVFGGGAFTLRSPPAQPRRARGGTRDPRPSPLRREEHRVGVEPQVAPGVFAGGVGRGLKLGAVGAAHADVAGRGRGGECVADGDDLAVAGPVGGGEAGLDLVGGGGGGGGAPPGGGGGGGGG